MFELSKHFSLPSPQFGLLNDLAYGWSELVQQQANEHRCACLTTRQQHCHGNKLIPKSNSVQSNTIRQHHVNEFWCTHSSMGIPQPAAAHLSAATINTSLQLLWLRKSATTKRPTRARQFYLLTARGTEQHHAHWASWRHECATDVNKA